MMRKPFAISFPKGNLINLDDMHEHLQFMGLSTKGIWPMHMTYSGFFFCCCSTVAVLTSRSRGIYFNK